MTLWLQYMKNMERGCFVQKNPPQHSFIPLLWNYRAIYLWWLKWLVYYIALKVSFKYITYCYAKQTLLGTPYVSGCYDFLHSSTIHCYPWIWFQSLVETQGLPLSVFGLSPQSILHLTSFGWTHKITVSGPGLVNLAMATLSGASLLLKLI